MAKGQSRRQGLVVMDPYKLQINAVCPQCGEAAERRRYPPEKNRGHGTTEYIHEVRRGLFGMREIGKSCCVPDAIGEAQR